MGSERRTRIGPVIAVGVLGFFVAIWVTIAVQHRMGLSTNPKQIDRTGTAQVSSCSKSAAYLWLTMTCAAQIRWDGEEGTIPKRLHSVRDVSGTTVAVDLLNDKRTRSGGSTRVTTADFPYRQDAALTFTLTIGIPAVGLALGALLGTGLTRFLPEPPPERPVLRPLRRTRSRRR